MIPVGRLTTAIVSALAGDSGVLVGDGVAPTAGGWSNGQPNVGEYTGYGVFSFRGGNPRDPSIRYDSDVRAWVTQWQLGHYGASREQCDWVAERLRNSLSALHGVSAENTPLGVTYSIKRVEVRSLGAMTRVDQTDPPLWSMLDVILLHAVT